MLIWILFSKIDLNIFFDTCRIKTWFKMSSKVTVMKTKQSRLQEVI